MNQTDLRERKGVREDEDLNGDNDDMVGTRDLPVGGDPQGDGNSIVRMRMKH